MVIHPYKHADIVCQKMSGGIGAGFEPTLTAMQTPLFYLNYPIPLWGAKKTHPQKIYLEFGSRYYVVNT